MQWNSDEGGANLVAETMLKTMANTPSDAGGGGEAVDEVSRWCWRWHGLGSATVFYSISSPLCRCTYLCLPPFCFCLVLLLLISARVFPFVSYSSFSVYNGLPSRSSPHCLIAFFLFARPSLLCPFLLRFLLSLSSGSLLPSLFGFLCFLWVLPSFLLSPPLLRLLFLFSLYPPLLRSFSSSFSPRVLSIYREKKRSRYDFC